MLKWKVLAVVGLSFGSAGIAWGFTQQQSAPGFYVLRIYTAQPGKRDALAARFASRTADLSARHGITNVGFWIPQQTNEELGIDAEDTFIYIRGYPSKDERDKRLTAFLDDPEFGEIVISQERDPNRRLIAKAHSIDMVPSGPQTAIRITQ